MKRILPIFLVIPLALTVLFADEPKNPVDPKDDEEAKTTKPLAPKPAPTLQVGDAPPPLKATTWLQGAAVSEMKSDEIYVVEFWATWCGPCIVMMPHLAELSERYKDQGVTVIGYTAKDPNNEADKVAAFVSKRGPKLKYTFAYSDSRETYDAWMRAAGQAGIPCTFVVGREGKLAYIGHPMYLDIVLPKVVDGTWQLREDNELIKSIEVEVAALFKAMGGPDAEAGLQALAAFETKYPKLSKVPFFVGPKIQMMLKIGKTGEAAALAKTVIADALVKDDLSMLSQLAVTLCGPDAKKDKELTALAIDCAGRLVQMSGETDLSGQFTLARVRYAVGDKKAARIAAERVVELAPESAKATYKRMLKEILEDVVAEQKQD